MAQYVLAQVDEVPDKTALEVLGAGPNTLTYRALQDRVIALSAQLQDRVPAPDTHVMLRLGNTPMFPIAYLAAIYAGLVPVVTSAKLTQVEVNAMAEETQPKLAICDPDLPRPRHCPALMTADIDFDQKPDDIVCHMGDPNRPAYIVFTSGTSGVPRAVVHAHRAVWARQMMFDGWYGLKNTDRLMHAGAFNWTYTLGTGLIDPWTVGATALIPADGTDPAKLMGMMADHDVTIFAAAPGVYRRLLRTDAPDLPKLRHGLSAGEKLPQTTRDVWEKQTGTPIFEAYGMSECSTFLSGSPTRPAPAGTLGFPQTGRDVKILGNTQTPNTGMVAIKNTDPGLMLGYLNQPDETAARFDGEWFLTGDIATETSGGAYIYEGRADDMMNAGGFRVSPIEVETVLSTCAQISEAACAEVRVKSDLSLIAAFYIAQDVIDQDQITAQLARQLADYKIPRIFVRVDALPRGTNNKLLRRKLRQDWETAHGQT